MTPACSAWSDSPRWALYITRGAIAAAVTALAVFFMMAPPALAADAPTVTRLSAVSGPTAGGVKVVITGTGFVGLSGAGAVSFGDTGAASYTVDSPTQITAVTPAHAMGKVQVKVTVSGLVSANTSADDYTFMVRYDQTDVRLRRGGGWNNISAGGAWGGSYFRATLAGSYMLVTFTGTRLDWIAMKGTTGGLVDVYVDGTLVKTVNLYSPVTAYQQKVWTTGTLANGAHRVKIVRNAADPTGIYATIDAFDVLGAVSGYRRVEEADSRLAYKGTWSSVAAFGASAGNYTRTTSTSASVVVDFTGTYLSWIATKAPVGAKARVSVDGGAAVSVDLAGTAWYYQAIAWRSGTLSSGSHEVKIWYDTASPAGSYLSVDAFDTDGTVVQAYFMTRYEQVDPRLLYDGPWSIVSSPSASGGNYAVGGAGSGVTVNFTGVRLDWVATFGPSMGVADVLVDGKPAVAVDLSSTGSVFKKVAYSTGVLTNGKHVVEISWDEGNDPGDTISLDAFDVAGTVPWELTLSLAQALWVEQRLSALSYRPGTVDGIFDYRTRGAIIAFEKWEGMTRDGEISAPVLNRLIAATRPKPTRTGATSPWIEVNKTKQVLLLCKNGAVLMTLPVSTGSASVGIVTPSGTFKVTRKNDWETYRYHPFYISTTLLAIHGYTNVPVYPASHGCVRTHPWDQDDMYPLVPVGTYVYIY